MEINFKRVHTGRDLTISTIVLLTGAGLFLVNKGLGIFIVVCALLMFLLYKGGYRKNGQGVILTKKCENLCKSCKQSVVEFLSGKDVIPCIKNGNEGGIVRLEVYYNQNENIAYAQLYDFSNYKYETVTGIVELEGKKAHTLISKLQEL